MWRGGSARGEKKKERILRKEKKKTKNNKADEWVWVEGSK